MLSGGRWLAGPIAFGWMAGAWSLATWTSGTPATAGTLLWALAYLVIFWGGWLAIPVLGVGATFAQPMLSPDWRAPVRGWFVAWLMAWTGILAALWWLGAPPGFERIPA